MGKRGDGCDWGREGVCVIVGGCDTGDEKGGMGVTVWKRGDGLSANSLQLI